MQVSGRATIAGRDTARHWADPVRADMWKEFIRDTPRLQHIREVRKSCRDRPIVGAEAAARPAQYICDRHSCASTALTLFLSLHDQPRACERSITRLVVRSNNRLP